MTSKEIPIRHVANERRMAAWLFLCAAMVFVMVVLGGTTRLSNAGLSIVEWQPLIGALPPMSEAEWEKTFAKYRSFPEYQKRNAGMTLAEFKPIFWLEYFHRLWGRIIGVVFIVPFLYFWFRGGIRKGLVPKLLGIFLLGGLQGWLGWYMVESGLVDRPDVSPYRLAAHLGLALLIFALLFRLGLRLFHPPEVSGSAKLFRGSVRGMLALVFLTAIAGAFVAGTDAGFAYNTFPRMGEGFVPKDYWALEPAWRNFFENIPSVQFNHRLLGITTFLGIGTLWLASWKTTLSERACSVLSLLFGVAILQASLGIATLLLVVPLPLGVAHQAGAVLLFACTLWMDYEIGNA